MNTRWISVPGVTGLLVCAAAVAGCSAPNNGELGASGPVTTSAGAAPAGQPKDIVMVVEGEASLKEDYATIKELAGSRNVVAVVRGTITRTRDVYLERFGFRILSVDVTEHLRGQTGKQISVLEDGGIVPYTTAAADMPRKDGDPSSRHNPTGFVDFRFMGARHSEAGDEVVLFLGVNPNKGTVIETEYNVVSSVRGRFTLDANTKTFVRTQGTPDKDLRRGFVRSTDVATLKNEIAAA